MSMAPTALRISDRLLTWRKMTWVLVIWCVGITVWMIGGGASAQSSADCASENSASAVKLCQDAAEIGTGIGIALIGTLGFFGFVALSLVWFMTRPKHDHAVA